MSEFDGAAWFLLRLLEQLDSRKIGSFRAIQAVKDVISWLLKLGRFKEHHRLKIDQASGTVSEGSNICFCQQRNFPDQEINSGG